MFLPMTETKLIELTDRALLELRGNDARGFLQNLVSNDLQKIDEQEIVYAALLTPQGKFLHDFFVLPIKNGLLLDCDNARIDDLIRRLTMYKLRADIVIENVTAQRCAFASIGADLSASDDLIQAADPRLPALGFRIYANNPAQAEALRAAHHPFADYEKHRLSLGIPKSGTDIQPEKNFLLEANIEELNGISFSKGCYVGQELTARTKYRAKIKKRLFSFTFDGDIAPGDQILCQTKELATVTSFERPYGMALTRLKEFTAQQENGLSVTPDGLTLFKPDYVILPDTEE
jgi:tRNA-modifying protein YgfZ